MYPQVVVAARGDTPGRLSLVSPNAGIKGCAATKDVVYILTEAGTVMSVAPRITKLPFSVKVRGRGSGRVSCVSSQLPHAAMAAPETDSSNRMHKHITVPTTFKRVASLPGVPAPA